MSDNQDFTAQICALEARLTQLAETYSILGEASARGLERAATALEAIVEHLEHNRFPAEAS